MIRLALIAVVLVFAGWLNLERIERALVYPFDTSETAPDLPGVTAHDFDHDGVRLLIWTAPPRPGKPVILYLHGNAGALSNRSARFRHFLDRGYGLIAPAYRGSSGSGGIPSQEAITADLRAIWAARATFVPDGAPVILYGESLGTGIAMVALLSQPDAPKAAMLEAPYTSIMDVARAAYAGIDPLLPQLRNRWDSLAVAPDVTARILVLHGSKDQVIPIEQGRKLFAALSSKDKQFIESAQADHHTLWRSNVLPRMWRFIDAR